MSDETYDRSKELANALLQVILAHNLQPGVVLTTVVHLLVDVARSAHVPPHEVIMNVATACGAEIDVIESPEHDA